MMPIYRRAAKLYVLPTAPLAPAHNPLSSISSQPNSIVYFPCWKRKQAWNSSMVGALYLMPAKCGKRLEAHARRSRTSTLTPVRRGMW